MQLLCINLQRHRKWWGLSNSLPPKYWANGPYTFDIILFSLIKSKQNLQAYIFWKNLHALITSWYQFFSPNTLEEICSFGMYVNEQSTCMFTAAEIGLMCSQFCKFDGTLGKLERVYEEDRVWEWYHAINKLILFCIYTAEASLRINMWPSRLLMAHIQYTEKRSIFFHLNVELENRETERKL